MKVDDIPVVGETAPEQADPSRPPRRWGIALGAAMVAVVVGLSVWLGSEPEPAPALPEPAPVTTTTAALGEFARMAQPTLTWSPVTGLEDVVRIHELLELGDTDLAIVTDDDGLAVYASEDGTSWQRRQVLRSPSPSRWGVMGSQSPAWWGAAAAVIDDRAVVVANGFSLANGFTVGASTDPLIWTSSDGATWSSNSLPPLEPAWPGSVAHGVASLDGAIVVSGWSIPSADLTEVVEGLPAEVRNLIQDGHAAAFINNQTLMVRMEPFPLIYSRPLTGAEVKTLVPPPGAFAPIQWRGSDGASMTASQPDTVATLLGNLENGDILGLINGLAVSSDGENWTVSSAGIELQSESIWGDLVVGSSLGMTDLRYWDPQTGDHDSISPTGIFDARAEIMDVAAGGSGIAAVAGSTQFVRVESEPVHLADVEGGTVVLNRDLRIGMTREGGTEYISEPWSTEAEVTGDNLIFTIGGVDVEVPIERWLAAVARFTGPNQQSLTFSNFVVVHSPDGRQWSSTPWSDITGRSAVDPAVFATDDYLLAVDHSIEDPIREARIGRPTG